MLYLGGISESLGMSYRASELRNSSSNIFACLEMKELSSSSEKSSFGTSSYDMSSSAFNPFIGFSLICFFLNPIRKSKTKLKILIFKLIMLLPPYTCIMCYLRINTRNEKDLKDLYLVI